MTAPRLRNRYVDDSIATASPTRLLIMLFDRLILDLSRGEEAQRSGAREIAHNQLVHAQAILIELRDTLDVEAWNGGPGLAALYDFTINELVQANINQDAERTATCRQLLEPLRDAWREAAASLAEPTGTVPTGSTT